MSDLNENFNNYTDLNLEKVIDPKFFARIMRNYSVSKSNRLRNLLAFCTGLSTIDDSDYDTLENLATECDLDYEQNFYIAIDNNNNGTTFNNITNVIENYDLVDEDIFTAPIPTRVDGEIIDVPLGELMDFMSESVYSSTLYEDTLNYLDSMKGDSKTSISDYISYLPEATKQSEFFDAHSQYYKAILSGSGDSTIKEQVTLICMVANVEIPSVVTPLYLLPSGSSYKGLSPVASWLSSISINVDSLLGVIDALLFGPFKLLFAVVKWVGESLIAVGNWIYEKYFKTEIFKENSSGTDQLLDIPYCQMIIPVTEVMNSRIPSLGAHMMRSYPSDDNDASTISDLISKTWTPSKIGSANVISTVDWIKGKLKDGFLDIPLIFGRIRICSYGDQDESVLLQIYLNKTPTFLVEPFLEPLKATILFKRASANINDGWQTQPKIIFTGDGEYNTPTKRFQEFARRLDSDQFENAVSEEMANDMNVRGLVNSAILMNNIIPCLLCGRTDSLETNLSFDISEIIWRLAVNHSLSIDPSNVDGQLFTNYNNEILFRVMNCFSNNSCGFYFDEIKIVKSDVFPNDDESFSNIVQLPQRDGIQIFSKMRLNSNTLIDSPNNLKVINCMDQRNDDDVESYQNASRLIALILTAIKQNDRRESYYLAYDNSFHFNVFLPYIDKNYTAINARYSVATDQDNKEKFSSFLKAAATVLVIAAAIYVVGVGVIRINQFVRRSASKYTAALVKSDSLEPGSPEFAAAIKAEKLAAKQLSKAMVISSNSGMGVTSIASSTKILTDRISGSDKIVTQIRDLIKS